MAQVVLGFQEPLLFTESGISSHIHVRELQKICRNLSSCSSLCVTCKQSIVIKSRSVIFEYFLFDTKISLQSFQKLNYDQTPESS